jgi:predicted esterase
MIDRTRPKINITYPASNSTVSGILNITVNTSDNVAVSKVAFVIGRTKLGISLSRPFSIEWDTTKFKDGNYTITATAYDSSGNYQRARSYVVVKNTVVAPTCTWVIGPWSDWSSCVNGTQMRTRSVQSSLAGCIPSDPMPATSETQSCAVDPPSVITESIEEGSIISGSLRWSANNGPCTFWIDGVLMWTENLAPYDYNGTPDGMLDTTTLSNGLHTLKVAMKDGSGEHSVHVLVNNIPAQPTCTWVIGPWSPWSSCINGTQTRTRSVQSSLAGCIPSDPMPATSETQSRAVDPPPSGTIRYASPNGAGDGLTRSTPYKVANFLNECQAGYTLLMLSGKYIGASGMITPSVGKNGTSTNPITIKAEIDGTVEIDGQSLNKPCELLGNNWWVIEGLNMHHSGGDGNSNHVCNIKDSNDIVVKRCCGWEAQAGDTNIFRTQHGSRNQFIDCAAWGTARKPFSNSQGGDDAVFLRCFARWEGSTQEGPKKAFAVSYNSYRAKLLNCIATVDTLKMPQNYTLQDHGTPVGQTFTNYEVQQPDGGFSNDGFDVQPDVANVTMKGCISFVRNGQRYWNSFKKWAAPIASNVKGVIIENCATFLGTDHADYYSCFLEDPGANGNIVKDCSFIGGDRASIGSSWSQTNNLATSSMPTGKNITNAKAQIVNRYDINGNITNETLWPWPMNDRIKVAMILGGYQPFDVTLEVFGLGQSSNTSTGVTDVDHAAQLARTYLASTSSQRALLEPQLRAITSDIDLILSKTRPNNRSNQPKGRIGYINFEDPGNIAKYPNHQYHMFVPDHYDPTKPFGVIFWLHGGGTWDSGEMDHILTWDLDDETVTGRSLLRPYVDTSNYITIAPIAPFWMQGSFDLKLHANRWTVPNADRYLMDILTEVDRKYNIDFDRIAMVGFSMGGVGTAHHLHRLNDRLCAAVPFSFHWKVGNWSNLNNMGVYPICGNQDTAIPVGFARVASDILNESTSPHIYTEFNGGHEYGAEAESFISSFINGQSGILTTLKRNPYRTTVHAQNKWRSYITGENLSYSWDELPSPHTYWVTINQTSPGTILYDQAVQNGTVITRDAIQLAGAKVDASIAGNVITLTTSNVTSLSLWLTPQMVGNASNVIVVVNGTSMTYQMGPNLLDAVKSYERRWDWNMTYHYELVVQVP